MAERTLSWNPHHRAERMFVQSRGQHWYRNALVDRRLDVHRPRRVRTRPENPESAESLARAIAVRSSNQEAITLPASPHFGNVTKIEII